MKVGILDIINWCFTGKLTFRIPRKLSPSPSFQIYPVMFPLSSLSRSMHKHCPQALQGKPGHSGKGCRQY